MRWLQWGRQSSIFGLPIALVLITVAFWNISYIAHLRAMLDTSRYLSFLGLGQLSRPTFSLARVYLLCRILLNVTWGVTSLLNVILFQRVIWMAYASLCLGCLSYLYEVIGLLFAVVLFTAGARPDGFVDFRPIFQQMDLYPIPWPSRFYLFFALNLVTFLMGIIIILDAHLSYVKIVQVKGNGWERKAYYEIHQSEGETVATLQEHWDARMGIQDVVGLRGEGSPERKPPRPHNNIPSPAGKDRSAPSAGETLPLVANV